MAKLYLVDYLKSLGLPSDPESRKKYAELYKIPYKTTNNARENELLRAAIEANPSIAQGIVDVTREAQTETPLLRLGGLIPQKAAYKMPKPKVDDPLAARALENQAKTLAKDALEVQQFKQQGIAEGVKGGVQAITGLAQLIAGRKIKKGLNAPKYPEELQNVQLSTRLAEAQRESQMADPAIRERMMRDLVRNKLMQDEYAKVASGGDISAYGGLTQAAQTRNIDAYRDIAAQEGADKLAKQRVYDDLLRQKIAEDASRYQNRVDRFRRVDYPEYEARRDYASNLTNQGMQGMFNAGQNVISNAMPLIGYGRGLSPQIQSRFSALPPKLQQQLNSQYPRYF